VELYRRILEVGRRRATFDLADDSYAIARNIVALEDAYGLYIIGGAPMHEEAIRLVVSFAAIATRCALPPDPSATGVDHR
jgi:hypothetical protein